MKRQLKKLKFLEKKRLFIIASCLAIVLPGKCQNYLIQSITPDQEIFLEPSENWRYITDATTIKKIAAIAISYQHCLAEIEIRGEQASEFRAIINGYEAALDSAKATKNIVKEIEKLSNSLTKKAAIRAWFKNAWKTIVIAISAAIIAVETAFIIYTAQ